MTIFRRASAGLVVSGALALELFYAPALTYADFNGVKLVNVKTGKCLTIAGGVSTENNVEALQFDCDRDPSRTWTLNGDVPNGSFEIRNVKTGKCLTIAGGVSTENNVEALQFDCDNDPSRTWRMIS
jgi:hypothetical protein